MTNTAQVEHIIRAFWDASKDCGPAEVAPALIYLAAEYIARWPDHVQARKRAEFDAFVTATVERINREMAAYLKLIGENDGGSPEQ